MTCNHNLISSRFSTLCGTITKFKAYLAKTIQGGWAEGYESEKTQERRVDFSNMALANLKLLASADNIHAQKELARRQ